MPRQVCKRCTRPAAACYCHLLVSVANGWPVLILQHAREARHALNTAVIAQHCLQQVRLLQVEDDSTDETLQQILAPTDTQPVLVYPGDGGMPLAELATGPPVPLLFLDASWRKSRRLLLQSSWLRSLPRVALQPAAPARYRIRREPRPGFRSTLEAIVEVLDAVEGGQASALLPIMDWMVAQQLAAMGEEVFAANYGAARRR